jgi:hypothetical protein
MVVLVFILNIILFYRYFTAYFPYITRIVTVLNIILCLSVFFKSYIENLDSDMITENIDKFYIGIFFINCLLLLFQIIGLVRVVYLSGRFGGFAILMTVFSSAICAPMATCFYSFKLFKTPDE